MNFGSLDFLPMSTGTGWSQHYRLATEVRSGQDVRWVVGRITRVPTEVLGGCDGANVADKKRAESFWDRNRADGEVQRSALIGWAQGRGGWPEFVHE